MRIVKVINNNIVTSTQDGNEVIVMGKGLGFNKTGGDIIPQAKIDKVFALNASASVDRFKLLLKDVPMQELQASDEIISYAKLSLGKRLSDSIYVALTDHIHFAIQRFKKGMDFGNALSWEVKHFYNHEYLIGKEGLNIIEKRTGTRLPDDEAVIIALHLVNAELDSSMDHTVGMTKLIKEILGIIQYTFHVELSDTSLAYERLMTHLKFFIQRVMTNQPLPDNDDKLFNMIKETYPNEFKCSLKISKYVKKELNYDLTDAELSYLTIHINRVITEN